MEKRRNLDPIQIELIFLYLDDPIAAQEKVKEMLWEAIRYFGTHTETAKRFGLIQQTFSYRLNYAKTIHLEDALKMLAVLQSKKPEPEIWSDFIDSLMFSEQVRIALEDLEKNRMPRGRKSIQSQQAHTLICQNVCEHFDTLHQEGKRFDDVIAKKYGFGNRTTFWQAVQVTKTGCPRLIQAVDDGEITAYKAFLFSAYSFEVQEQLLEQERFKQKHKKRRSRMKLAQLDYLALVQTFKTDAPLNAMAQQTQAPIMSRITEILHHFFMHQENPHHAPVSPC